MKKIDFYLLEMIPAHMCQNIKYPSRFCENSSCFSKNLIANQTHFISECDDTKIKLERSKLNEGIIKILSQDKYILSNNLGREVSKNDNISSYFEGNNNLIWEKLPNIENLDFAEDDILTFKLIRKVNILITRGVFIKILIIIQIMLLRELIPFDKSNRMSPEV